MENINTAQLLGLPNIITVFSIFFLVVQQSSSIFVTMRTIGLLGGMSWESSSLYYININRAVREKLGGTHSCKLIMYSFDFAEIEELQAAGDWSALAHMLATAATGLQKAGAEGLVLCTNTMHKVAAEVEAAAGIPLLHIADFTGRRITQQGLKKVGLLATRYTMEQDFYKQRLIERFDLEVLAPSKDDRDVVHGIIYEELVRGIVRKESRQTYINIINSLVAEGAECIILGCTEITLLISQENSPVPVFDTTALHCEGAAEWALRN
jgi:aspartate racemase